MKIKAVNNKADKASKVDKANRAKKVSRANKANKVLAVASKEAVRIVKTQAILAAQQDKILTKARKKIKAEVKNN